jgi:Zn finger protein HypA/HybF involved in hydrogenase expression
MEKIHETMWCFNCDTEFETDDYYKCNACPNCVIKPVRIYRMSSFAFVYAYLEKHPEKSPKIDEHGNGNDR